MESLLWILLGVEIIVVFVCITILLCLKCRGKEAIRVPSVAVLGGNDTTDSTPQGEFEGENPGKGANSPQKGRGQGKTKTGRVDVGGEVSPKATDKESQGVIGGFSDESKESGKSAKSSRKEKEPKVKATGGDEPIEMVGKRGKEKVDVDAVGDKGTEVQHATNKTGKVPQEGIDDSSLKGEVPGKGAKHPQDVKEPKENPRREVELIKEKAITQTGAEKKDVGTASNLNGAGKQEFPNVGDKASSSGALDSSSGKGEESIKVGVESQPIKTSGTKLFTSYKPINLNDKACYPRVSSPEEGSIVLPHRVGKTRIRGYKEEAFEQALKLRLGKTHSQFMVQGGVALYHSSTARPYEPDIAIIERNGSIRVDIEIDEPYSGYKRNAIHLLGTDEANDRHRNRLGWVVLRFTEHQVHCHTEQCLLFVEQLLTALSKGQDCKVVVPEEKAWSLVEAQKMERERYRESYLGIESFGRVEVNLPPQEDEITLTPEEQRALTELKHDQVDPLNFPWGNKKNKSERDDAISFDALSHTYSLRGMPLVSVSSLIAGFFPEFDSEYWSERKARERGVTKNEILDEWELKGARSREVGTHIHEQIERMLWSKRKPKLIYNFSYIGRTFKHEEQINVSCELGYFNALREVSPFAESTVYRTEWRIYDETLAIAGTIDSLLKTRDGRYIMVDWKCSEKIGEEVGQGRFAHKESNPWQKGYGPLQSLDDTSYNRYLVQQNIYKYILKRRYGIEVSEMYLAVIHNRYSQAHLVPVPDRQEFVEQIFSVVK